MEPPDEDKPFPCSQCGRHFSSLGSLKQHQKIICGKSPTQPCPMCPYKTFYRRNLVLHMKTKHGVSSLMKIVKDKPFQCETCKQGYVDKYKLNKHLIYCGKEPTQQCPKCPYITLLPSTLRAHIQVYHGNDVYLKYKHEKKVKEKATKRFPCPQCERGFQTEHQLKRHLKFYCSRPRAEPCPHCPFTTTTRDSLRGHIRRRHGLDAVREFDPPKIIKPFICNECGKGFSHKNGMAEHLRVYCGKEPTLECPECHRMYFTLNLIRCHLVRSHSHEALKSFNLHYQAPDKPYKCSGCGLAFLGKQNLYTHRRIGCSKLPNQSCPECSYVTFFRSNLIRHVRNMHGSTALDKLPKRPYNKKVIV